MATTPRKLRLFLESHHRQGHSILMLAARTKAFVAAIDAALKINGDPIPLVLIDWKGDPETEHWTERLGGADGGVREPRTRGL